MNEIAPRMAKLLKWQQALMFVCSILACINSVMLWTSIMGWGFLSFLGSMCTAWIFMKVFTYGITFILQLVFYGTDFQTMMKDAQAAAQILSRKEAPSSSVANQVSLKITAHSEPFGKYKDCPMYDWLDVIGADEKTHRFSYHSTMDIEAGQTFQIPDGCILLPPGIMYQVDTPVNTPT